MADEPKLGSKILVVDDDPNVVELVRLYLERDGHEVLIANDGVAGLEMAREELPDLIVLDLMMPRMDGMEVCRTLRAESSVPVIMLTAMVEEDDRLAGLELRPSLVIDANVDFDQLDDDFMAFIDRLQPCGQGNPYPLLSTSSVEVRSKRTVGQGGRHLKLTVRQAGRVFDAIAFGFGDQAGALPDRLELAYRLERNEFRGAVSLQLNVQDIRPL